MRDRACLVYSIDMGEIERKHKKKQRRSNIQSIVLRTVSLSGVLAVSLLAPNAIKVFKDLGLIKNKRHNEIIKNSKNRLVEKGLLYFKNGFLELTDKGEKELERLENTDWKIDKPKKWDGKWRVLIFDIPEYRKSTRDKVRRTLISIGFVKLQNSVWVYPYDCEDTITLLKSDFKIGKDLLYMIAHSIENDGQLRQLFGLTN